MAQSWVKYSDLKVMSGVSITQKPWIPQRKIEEGISNIEGQKKLIKQN